MFVRDLDSDWSVPDDVEGSGARRVTANAQRNIELYTTLEYFLARHLGGLSSTKP